MKQARFFWEVSPPILNWESGFYYQRLLLGTAMKLNCDEAGQSHWHPP